MADKNLYANDLIHRYLSHTFTETTVGSETKVEFKNAISVLIRSAQNLLAIDSYRTIRQDLLKAENPLYLSTTTERDALTNVDTGTTIYNITTNEDETYNGTGWVAAGGELGGLTHLPAATITTTDNTQTILKEITLEANKAYLFTAEIIGETVDHGIVIGAIIDCTAKRLSTGGAVLVGGVTNTHIGKDSGAASWGVTFTVSGNSLRVSVTGGNATTVMWEVDINYLEY